MAAYLYRALSGIAGDITRPDVSIVESGFFNSSYLPTAFGAPVKVVSGLFRAIASGDAASDFYGVVARIAPAIGGTPNANGESTTLSASYAQSIVVSGFVNVLCPIGTPVRGGPVYMRVQADTGKYVGDLEVTPSATFTGGAITGTGTGTIAGTATPAVPAGTWRITLLSTSQTAACSVVDPSGNVWPNAIVGTQYSKNGLVFTITAAGTMTSGDYFAPVIVANNVLLTNVVWAVDGKGSDNTAEIHIKK